jgi:urea transporter
MIGTGVEKLPLMSWMVSNSALAVNVPAMTVPLVLETWVSVNVQSPTGASG